MDLRDLYNYYNDYIQTIYDPCPHCKHSIEVTIDDFDCLEIYNVIDNEKIEQIARKYRNRRLRPKKLLRQIAREVAETVKYDTIHANASSNYRTLAYTYLTGREAVELERGICGEQSQVLLGVLRHLEIKSILYRPTLSHIAVVAELDRILFLVDVTFGRVDVLPKIFRKWNTRNYVYGAISLEEFYKQTVNKRRRLGKQYFKLVRELVDTDEEPTPQVLIDLEYVRHCLEPPYRTVTARRFLHYLEKVGYCKAIVHDYIYAEILGDMLAQCSRPEICIDRECYNEAWRRAGEEYRKYLRTRTLYR